MRVEICHIVGKGITARIIGDQANDSKVGFDTVESALNWVAKYLHDIGYVGNCPVTFGMISPEIVTKLTPGEEAA